MAGTWPSQNNTKNLVPRLLKANENRQFQELHLKYAVPRFLKTNENRQFQELQLNGYALTVTLITRRALVRSFFYTLWCSNSEVLVLATNSHNSIRKQIRTTRKLRPLLLLILLLLHIAYCILTKRITLFLLFKRRHARTQNAALPVTYGEKIEY